MRIKISSDAIYSSAAHLMRNGAVIIASDCREAYGKAITLADYVEEELEKRERRERGTSPT